MLAINLSFRLTGDKFVKESPGLVFVYLRFPIEQNECDRLSRSPASKFTDDQLRALTTKEADSVLRLVAFL